MIRTIVSVSPNLVTFSRAFWPGATSVSIVAAWNAGVEVSHDIMGLALGRLLTHERAREDTVYRWTGDAILMANPDNRGGPRRNVHAFVVINAFQLLPQQQRSFFALLGGKARLPPYLWVVEEEEPVRRKRELIGEDRPDPLALLFRIARDAGLFIELEEPRPPGSPSEMGRYLILLRGQAGKVMQAIETARQEIRDVPEAEGRLKLLDAAKRRLRELLDLIGVLIDLLEAA